MPKLALLLALMLPYPAEAARQICYFSLNNQREVTSTQKFANEVAPGEITVKEYMTAGSDPQKSFQQMVASGVHCDGLVITGHHTGAWGGSRAKGKMSIDYIEKLACDPQYREFFQNVNALWLEGCRTTGVGTITPNNKDDDANSVDFHTKRVNAERQDVGDIAKSVAGLNNEFTNTLDQDNPLSSRYLRAFPRARVFGWAASAPGSDADSEKSILYHFAHMVERLDPEDKNPGDPTKPEFLSPKNLTNYFKAMETALAPYQGVASRCDAIVQAWVDHGTIANNYALDNPGLKAFTPAAAAPDAFQTEVQAQQCAIRKALQDHNESLLLHVADMVDSDPRYHQYSANLLLSAYTQLKNEKSPIADSLRAKLISDAQKQEASGQPSSLSAWLDRRLDSSQVGLFRKIDYLKLRQNLLGKPMSDYSQKYIDRVTKELSPALPRDCTDKAARSNELSLRRDYFDAITKNGVADFGFYTTLLEQTGPQPDTIVPGSPTASGRDDLPNVDWDVLRNMAADVRFIGLEPEYQQEMLFKILRHPNADPVVRATVVAELQRLHANPDVIAQAASAPVKPEFHQDAFCAAYFPSAASPVPDNVPKDPTKKIPSKYQKGNGLY